MFVNGVFDEVIGWHYGDLEILRLRTRSYVSMLSYGRHYCDQSSVFDFSTLIKR